MSELLPAGAAPIGLGCSRLGSVGGPGPDEVGTLLRRALEGGVRLFDTSNIYGQGDSERFLGACLIGCDDAVIVSKAGKYVSWNRRLLLPVKSMLRVSAKQSHVAKQKLVAARKKPMPSRWDRQFLISSLDGTLRRLKRERVDVFLLHGPPAEVVRDGEAASILESAREAGKIGTVGVSVDDRETALLCLADERIRVLQIPLPPGSNDYDDVLSRAVEANVRVIAREILGGPDFIKEQADPRSVARSRIIDMVRDNRVAVPLVGATKMQTLSASIEAAEYAVRPDTHPPKDSREGNLGG